MRAHHLVLPLVMTLGLQGCSDPPISEVRVDNVARVFWHERSYYSVLVETAPGQFQMMRLPNACYEYSDHRVTIRHLSDVPTSKLMWVQYKLSGKTKWNGECFWELDIHLHSPADLNGGGWNHGKFGRGETVVVE